MLRKQLQTTVGIVMATWSTTGAVPAIADIIVGYGSENAAEGSPAIDLFSGVLALDLSRGDGLNAGTGATFNSSGWTDEPTDFLEWGWTSSTPLDLTDLDLRYDRSTSGPSSVDVQLAVNGGAYTTVFMDDSVSVSGEDILDVDLTDYTGVTSASFRLFGTGASSGSGTFDIESISGLTSPRGIVVSGTAAAVPEPSGLQLAGVASVGALLIRRLSGRRKT